MPRRLRKFSAKTAAYMQGAPKKTSGRSYSLERPVARHFVCYYSLHIACRTVTCCKYMHTLFAAW
jgi:hypothetical protein